MTPLEIDPKFLLNAASDNDNASPVDVGYINLAARHGKFEIVKLLVEIGRLDPAFKDPYDYSNTALHHACRIGDVQAFDWLIEIQTVKDTVDAPNQYGRTPISCAAKNGHSEIVDRLLKFDAVDPRRADNSQNNALAWALKRDHYNIAQTIASDIKKKQEAKK
ncbi:hypothetical protein FSST1_010214 [Fusarium sambucinum]